MLRNKDSEAIQLLKEVCSIVLDIAKVGQVTDDQIKKQNEMQQ